MSDQSPVWTSPRLDHCPPSLPSEVYRDPARYQLEIERIFARSWIYVGRSSDLKTNVMKRVSVAGQSVILLKDEGGTVRAYRNVCRHRGSELCVQDEQALKGKLITCPYHAWAYATDGRLVSTAFARPTKDFDRGENGLIQVALHLWNGLVFACLSDTPPDFDKVPDVGPKTLDNWPIETLVTGLRQQTVVSCNWKVFWENYSECLHCPGIHPMLSDFVPVYAKGVMAANESHDWTPEKGVPDDLLKPGARSWTMNGQPCGPEFPNLTDAERLAGYTFVTLWPSCFVVAHTDYVRVVTVSPLTPGTTQLTAEWLFPAETLAQADFDLKNVTDFATTVLMEDAAACEMNQRGLAMPGFQGRLMPEEYEIHRFHQWVEEHLEMNQFTKINASPAPKEWDRRGLPGWAYHSKAFLKLEMEEIFLTHWQIIGHVSDIANPGDFITLDVGPERVVVIRGQDGEVRALHNLCRHRGSRVVGDAEGNCRNAMVCPFHGWVYNLDGTLRGAARPGSFGEMDKDQFGLKPVESDIWHGFIFVRFKPGPQGSLAEAMAPYDEDLAAYRFEDLVPARKSSAQEIPVNWKSVRDVDNEGYHVAMAHPALQDLYGPGYLDLYLDHGRTISFGPLTPGQGRRWSVRHYLKLATDHDWLPEEKRRVWSYFGLFPNAVLAVTPESVSFYHEFPLGVDRTLLKGRSYRRRDEDRQQRAARYLAGRIDNQTYKEDIQLSIWSNEAMKSSAFDQFHLSDLEYGVRNHHDELRSLLPVLWQDQAPSEAEMADLNEALRNVLSD